MTGEVSGAERAPRLSQSKAEYVKHSDIYGSPVPTPLSGNGDVLHFLNIMGI
jgi:hypothetical protein